MEEATGTELSRELTEHLEEVLSDNQVKAKDAAYWCKQAVFSSESTQTVASKGLCLHFWSSLADIIVGNPQV